MKKLLCLVIITVLVVFTFAGCTANDTVLFNKVDLSKCVELGKYKGIPVDTKSETYKGYYDDIIASDVSTNNLYVQKTDGVVAFGDNVNIDYVGKIDGVAFEGGTASGSDLLIGSKSFIDGFEDGLVGVTIGSTVDLNLKFPDDYHSKDVAGKAVVFTVKDNYVKTEDPQKPEEFFEKLGYKTLKEYEKRVNERATNNYLIDTIVANSKFNDFPAKDIEIIYSHTKHIIDLNIQQQYGMTLEDYLKYREQSESEFKQDLIKSDIQPLMKTQMVMYSILEKEKIPYDSSEADAKITELIKQMGDSSVTKEDLIEYYGEYYFENIVISEKVIDFIYNNSKIS